MEVLKLKRTISSYFAESPTLLRDFMTYISTIRGKSDRTTMEYFLDLRMFLRFMKRYRKLVPPQTPLEEIVILDIDLDFLREITLSDVYAFLEFIAHERPTHPNSADTEYGLSPAARARKASSIRIFFKYLTEKANVLEFNPVNNLESPSQRRSLPKYLSLEDCSTLLSHVDGPYAERDYCMLILFLNCGLRVSELVGINLNDIRDRSIRILGKGDKERMLYLNDACMMSVEKYLPCRIAPHARDKNALFVSRNRNRISAQTVKWLVKKYLTQAGLDASKYSAHKLRHTAATLMYQNGVDIRTLQNVLGHVRLDTTMIYTHVDDIHVREAIERNPLSQMQQTSTPADDTSESDL